MDDFLSRYEVLGGKMRHVLDPTPGVEGNAGKLERIRRSLATVELGEAVEGEDPEVAQRRAEKERILMAVERQEREAVGRKDRVRMEYAKPKERWDCETVLSALASFFSLIGARLLTFARLVMKVPTRTSPTTLACYAWRASRVPSRRRFGSTRRRDSLSLRAGSPSPSPRMRRWRRRTTRRRRMILVRSSSSPPAHRAKLTCPARAQPDPKRSNDPAASLPSRKRRAKRQ